MPPGATTRFAPAPTGYLHLGHVANAIWVWGMARNVDGRVVLRIEDHDRSRSRAEYDEALLEDLAWLGFDADAGPLRQSDPHARTAYETAVRELRAGGRVYGCDCTRSTFAAWAESAGHDWHGPGCPGGCRNRGIDGPVLRVSMGDGVEGWDDILVGARTGQVAPSGDPPIRDRHGNWTYGFSVVVDDLRQAVDLVIRGEDLLDATPSQIRLAHLLGREAPARFLHHPLIRRPDGRKLSKADGATGVRELRAAGRSAPELIGAAAAAIGLLREARPVAASEVGGLIRGRAGDR